MTLIQSLMGFVACKQKKKKKKFSNLFFLSFFIKGKKKKSKTKFELYINLPEEDKKRR